MRLPRRERDFLLAFEATLLGATYAHWINRRDGDWAAQREAWFSRHPQEKCFICSSGLDLRLHHRTYKRIAEPLDEDLIATCRSCHQDVHFYVAEHWEKEDSLRTAHEVLRARTDAQREAQQRDQQAHAAARIQRDTVRRTERTRVIVAELLTLRKHRDLKPIQKARKVNLVEELRRLGR